MSSATLFSVSPFDATKEHTFTFKYTGNQAVKNKLLIKNNATSATVYEKEVVTFSLSHTIPANTLKNGTTYSVQVRVYDQSNAATSYSTAVIFTCLSTPSFYFSNLSAGQIIKNITFQANLIYSQAQGEKLNSFYIILYDENKQAVYQSATIYNLSPLSYELDSLNNGRSYHIKGFGQTVSGISIETDYIPFSVEYILPNMFSVVQVENNELPGTITVKSNLVLIEGKYDGAPTYSNGKIILTDGKPLIFDEGFDVTEDFAVSLVAENYTLGKEILVMNNGTISVSIYPGKKYSAYAGQYFARLRDSSNGYVYTLDSNYITGGKIQINIKRRSGLYTLQVLEVSK